MNTEVYPTANGGHTYVALIQDGDIITPYPLENWKLVEPELRRGIIALAVAQGMVVCEFPEWQPRQVSPWEPQWYVKLRGMLTRLGAIWRWIRRGYV